MRRGWRTLEEDRSENSGRSTVSSSGMDTSPQLSSVSTRDPRIRTTGAKIGFSFSDELAGTERERERIAPNV